MINPVISHSLIAFAVGMIGPEYYGAVFAFAFYYGRELSQYQTIMAREKGVTRSSLWKVWWPKGHEKEFLLPAFFAIIGSWLMWWSIG